MAFNQYNNNPYGQQQEEPRNLFPSLWGSQEDLDRATTSCLAKVFMRMFAALLVTAAVSFGVYSYPGAQDYLIANPMITIGAIILQLVVVMILSFRVMKMSPAVSNVMFFFYAILTGVTLSFIFISYEIGVIFQAFAVSALTFGAMSIYGTITRRDLTRLGSICIMGLIGIILASIVTFFLPMDNETGQAIYMIINYVAVLIFVGLTAYHTQRIKNMLRDANEANQEDAVRKISVYGALALYLSFINMFLRILAILGRRR